MFMIKDVKILKSSQKILEEYAEMFKIHWTLPGLIYINNL